MGAQPFIVQAEGETMFDALRNAADYAKHQYGHAGYTGTIAEKDTVVEIECGDVPLPTLDQAVEHANRLIDEGDERIEDKWGPAGAIGVWRNDDTNRPVRAGWVLFGWASS